MSSWWTLSLILICGGAAAGWPQANTFIQEWVDSNALTGTAPHVEREFLSIGHSWTLERGCFHEHDERLCMEVGMKPGIQFPVRFRLRRTTRLRSENDDNLNDDEFNEVDFDRLVLKQQQPGLRVKREALRNYREPSVDSTTTETTDGSSETTDESSGTTDESSGTTDESSGTTDESSETTDESSETTDESSETTDESSETTDESSETTDESSGTTDESSGTTDESSGTTDENSETTDGSAMTTGVTTEGDTETTGETTGGSAETTGGTTEGDTETTGETTDGSAETTGGTTETTGETTGGSGETAGGTTDGSAETTDGSAETTDGSAETTGGSGGTTGVSDETTVGNVIIFPEDHVGTSSIVYKIAKGKKTKPSNDYKKCRLPKPQKSAEALCKMMPGKMVCHLYCVFGHTFAEGIMRRTVCSFDTGKWSQPFDECKPFVDCGLKLMRAGSLKCLSHTVSEGPRCSVNCRQGKKRQHRCDERGTWTPALPSCVTKEGIATVDPPKKSKHDGVAYPEMLQKNHVEKTLNLLNCAVYTTLSHGCNTYMKGTGEKTLHILGICPC